VELLKEGLIWRIGNGENVYIWEDPWLPKGITRRPATPRGAALLTKVSELINPITGEWDEQLVCDTFWTEDAEILRIPVDVNRMDWPAWYFDAKGLFSVKSAYKVAVARRDVFARCDASSSGNGNKGECDFMWNKIWKLNVPNKVKMFLWRFAHNSLPVRRNVARRGVDIDTRCPMCERLDEDCGHLFFKCKFVRRCWRLMDMEDIRTEMMKCRSGLETCSYIWKLEKNTQLKVIVFLWRWWSARNKASDGGRMLDATEVYGSICYFLMEFEKLNTTTNKEFKAGQNTWKPPPVDIYKINSDGAFDHKRSSGGWGFNLL
jgi:hypothetical protein